MRIALLVMLTGLSAGCISPSEAMKMNAAAITDSAKRMTVQGSTPGDPLALQHVRNAETNELIIGSPKHRLDPRDVRAQEANRVQAQADFEAGGFWWMAGASLLGVGSLAASLLGLSGVARWLNGRKEQLVAIRKKAADYESSAEKYAGYLGTVVKGIEKFTESHADGAQALKHIIGNKARDMGDKPGFDKSVRAAQ